MLGLEWLKVRRYPYGSALEAESIYSRWLMYSRGCCVTPTEQRRNLVGESSGLVVGEGNLGGDSQPVTP